MITIPQAPVGQVEVVVELEAKDTGLVVAVVLAHRAVAQPSKAQLKAIV